MTSAPPTSHLLKSADSGGAPALHYLQWNPNRRTTLVLLHGNSANAWWWHPLAEVLGFEFRMLALDQRGHGDSEWVRPPRYHPEDYAGDLWRFIQHLGLENPVVVGHSMGGLNVLAFAGLHPRAARAAIAIDVAITSTNRRDRYVRRLKALPTVTYSDLATAKARFRLMPKEGNIPASTLAMIAEHSLRETDGGGFTFKFDRESFFGSDGLDAKAAVAHSPIPLLLVRAELSRIMTAEAARDAVKSNPAAHLVEISGVHHHLLLERPDLLAAALRSFVNGLG